MKEKYLPIGSVVLLKNADQELMIIGFASIDEDEPNNVYDYVGCIYPEGLIDLSEVELFNHDQIEKILFTGYETEKFKEYSNELFKLTEEYINDDYKLDKNELKEEIEVL